MNRNLLKRAGAFLLLALLLCAYLPPAFAAPDDEDEIAPVSDTSDSGEEGDTAPVSGSTDDGENEPDAVLEDPKIDATAALLVNPNTGMVLYEKNADEKRYPASTTKIMTALLVLENAKLDDVVTAEKVDFENVSWDASNADIKEGEQVKVLDLLYCLMLPSANEAANMLARHVGGSIEGFADMMNAKAEELGCTGTHFVNPNGLHDPNHYTTARDLYTIAHAAMQDETFAEIAKTAVKTISKTNMHDSRKVFTTNQLIFSSYQPWFYGWCNGIKTGHTAEAGNCLVAYADQRDSELYSVVLGCADAPDSSTVAKSFTETKRLFEWGYDNFKSKTLAKQGNSITSTKVRLSTDTDELVLTAKRDLVASVPKNLDVEDMEATPTVPKSVDAPIKAGDVIGSMTYSYAGTVYGTVELIALHDVELSKVLYYADKLENFFKGSVFKILLVVLLVFVILYILFNLTFGRMRRRKQRRMMRSRGSRYNRRR